VGNEVLGTIVILGAGATLGASKIDPTWKPPLMQNLSCVLNPSLPVFSQGNDSPKILKSLKEILDTTDTWNDFELLFTLFQVFDIASKNLKKNNVIINENDLQVLLLNHISDNVHLKEFNLNTHELECLNKLKCYYLKNGIDVINAPINIMLFFRRAIYEYMYRAITSVRCIYHHKLFRDLKNEDTVVSFNYDEIADYCLADMGKLWKNSFKDLGFAEISLPENKNEQDCVTFLKVHGSFNWTTKLNELGYFIDEVYYEKPTSKYNGQAMIHGNTPYGVVLPYRHKGFIYSNIPIYKHHIDRFIDVLRLSDKVIIVGKSFLNTDKDLADLIRFACSVKVKTLDIIDPKSEELEWKNYHEVLFNAQCVNHWPSLEAFYQG
jgi:hypothetical protein